MTYKDDLRLVALMVPKFVVDVLDRAAEANLLSRSTFLRMAIWRDLQREGWASHEEEKRV
jgi:metal-responsive CopG/Arc/MetJ family transcriptional regulator